MESKVEQNVFLYSRSRLEISGVLDVCEFTELSVELSLEDGYLGIDGEELKIDYFSSDSGKVTVHGSVSAITYYQKSSFSKKKKRRS
ncbi:MAG: YabP/YqfC family sporulation protein [Clostridia bacterium]|nr:YabP/YqfC family sporulation protein [Clostridia bacterium]